MPGELIENDFMGTDDIVVVYPKHFIIWSMVKNVTAFLYRDVHVM